MWMLRIFIVCLGPPVSYGQIDCNPNTERNSAANSRIWHLALCTTILKKEPPLSKGKRKPGSSKSAEDGTHWMSSRSLITTTDRNVYTLRIMIKIFVSTSHFFSGPSTISLYILGARYTPLLRPHFAIPSGLQGDELWPLNSMLLKPGSWDP